MRVLFLLTVAAMMCAYPATAQKKTIFVVTDAEGVSGVCRQDQADINNAEMRQLLTGEVNAAVDGFLEGGADEVIVWDGHGGSASLSALTIHPKAKLASGDLGERMTFDRRYAGIAFVGQHAMANVRGGIMCHSFSSLGIQNILVNGKPIGEIGALAAMAGAFDTPVIMLSGDRAAGDELRAIVPQAELAVVKDGLGRHTCIALSATAAREMIRNAARNSMRKMPGISPYKIAGPVTVTIERTTRNSLGIDAGLAPGSEVVDDRTMRYSGKDFVEAWLRARAR